MIVNPTVLFVALAVGLLALPLRADPLGQPPVYATRSLSEVPNAAAVTARIWMPGLDAGYVPQGVTAVGGALFVSAYRSVDPDVGVGPCRLYRLDPATGGVTGTLDLPPSCGHAGGLARGMPGHLVVADTKTLLEVAIEMPASPRIGRIVRRIALDQSVKGSFAASTPGALWLGAYARDGAPKLLRFTWPPGRDVLSSADATASVALPLNAQGAAFDASGRLWVSRSNSKFGELVQLDVATGGQRAAFALPAGTEDISFDSDGGLWTVSEAGSRRWIGWATFYPIIFRLDPGKLK